MDVGAAVCQTAGMLFRRTILFFACSAAFAAGCASSDSSPAYVSTGSDASDDQDAAVSDEDAAVTPEDAKPDNAAFDVQPNDSQAQDDTLMYAHDKDTLYTVDPKDPTLALKEVGTFDCIGPDGEPSMTDLAVDKDGKLYGVSARAIFLDMQVDSIGKVVNCGSGKVEISAGSASDARFFGLTFAPPTAALGNKETLIGANAIGELYAIDTSTGTLTLVGRFGAVPADDGNGHPYDATHVGKPWGLSGDMVFFSNEGSPVGFATLRDCEDPAQGPSTCSTVDTLVEIDIGKLAPAGAGGAAVVTKTIRGKVLPAGCSDETCGFGAMYGITAYEDKVYGFSYGGKIVSIDNSTGQAQLISSPLVQPGFAGAGVTTAARITPPQPK